MHVNIIKGIKSGILSLLSLVLITVTGCSQNKPVHIYQRDVTFDEINISLSSQRNSYNLAVDLLKKDTTNNSQYLKDYLVAAKNYSESLRAVLKSVNTVATLEYKDEIAVVKCTMSKDDFEACKLILQDLENELETIKKQ